MTLEFIALALFLCAVFLGRQAQALARIAKAADLRADREFRMEQLAHKLREPEDPDIQCQVSEWLTDEDGSYPFSEEEVDLELKALWSEIEGRIEDQS